MHLNYALKVDSITCFRQQLFYLTELNSTPEIKPSLSVATVVVQYSKLFKPFLSRHAMLLLLCWGRVLRDETKHGCDRERLGTLRSDNGDGNGNVRSLGRAGPRRVGVPAKIEITNFTSENVDDGH